MECQIIVTDFIEKGTAIYIKVEVYDSEKNERHQAELRFLEELLYGDLVHPKKSPLQEKCRLATIVYLEQYFNRSPK